ncbi:MAG: DUF2208 family protein [Candidatus Altiarchaeota archaeon]|nr:DUF2208 family protein [Candidatus Altiarchaeota archaeon]
MITITPDAWTIVFISLCVSIISSLVRKATLDVDRLRECKEEIKKHQDIMKDASKKGHTKKAVKSQEELTKLMMEQMKHSFKPMMITFIPIILIFTWLRGNYGDIGSVVTFPLHINLIVFSINGGLDWLGVYILSSIASSIILNKLMKLS